MGVFDTWHARFVSFGPVVQTSKLEAHKVNKENIAIDHSTAARKLGPILNAAGKSLYAVALPCSLEEHGFCQTKGQELRVAESQRCPKGGSLLQIHRRE